MELEIMKRSSEEEVRQNSQVGGINYMGHDNNPMIHDKETNVEEDENL